MNCPKCGVLIDDGSKFCSACGAPLSEKCSTEPNTTEGIPNSSIKIISPVSTQTVPPTRKKAIPIIIFLLLVLIVVGMFIQKSKSPNFKKLYDEYCLSTWASVGSDGSYLYVDTNPFDEDDNGNDYPAAFTAIRNINNELKLPDSLINDMANTTGLDGKQFEEFSDAGVSVSWKYHPDSGLEVTYKKMK